MSDTGQIIAFGIGSACIGAGIIAIIGGLWVNELLATIDRLQDRLDIERKTANAWFGRYQKLRGKSWTAQPRNHGKFAPKPSNGGDVARAA